MFIGKQIAIVHAQNSRFFSNGLLQKRPEMSIQDSNLYSDDHPPKNREFALCPNMRVVKCKYIVSQKRNEANDKIHWYNIVI